MARYMGYLGGTSPNPVTRTGTADSGIWSRLKALSGVEVRTYVGADDDGTDFIRVTVERRGQTLAQKVYRFDQNGDLIPES